VSRPTKIHAILGVSFDAALGMIAYQRKPTAQTIAARPFLKWVGGKRSILGELISRLPAQYGTYHEPFLGGGALFFAVQPSRACLSDVNSRLIITFKAVRDDVDRLISQLKIHQRLHTKDYYLLARDKLLTEKAPTKIAALLIYLNKTCFNGLYRVNRNGKFNVPIGSYVNPGIFEEDVLRNDSRLLKGANLDEHDFTREPIIRKDFYYLDPPYHQTFSGYTAGGFSDDHHNNLPLFCRKIDHSKAYFMLSNSDTPFIRELYRGFHFESVSASRSVSCKAHQRCRNDELIIRNYSEINSKLSRLTHPIQLYGGTCSRKQNLADKSSSLVEIKQ